MNLLMIIILELPLKKKKLVVQAALYVAEDTMNFWSFCPEVTVWKMITATRIIFLF